MAHSTSKRQQIDVGCEMLHPILFAPDVQAAADFYTDRLGFWLAFLEGDPANFAGVNLGHVQLFLERGRACPEGCAVYFVVDDVDALFRFHQSAGLQDIDAPMAQPYGLREYSITDLNGYRLTFGQRMRRTRQ